MGKRQGSKKFTPVKKDADVKTKTQIADEAQIVKLVRDAEKAKPIKQQKPILPKVAVKQPVYTVEKPFTRDPAVPIASPRHAGQITVFLPFIETRKPAFASEKSFTREPIISTSSPTTIEGKMTVSLPTAETRKPLVPGKPFPFLRLPQELQDQIYGYVYDKPTTYHVKWVSGHGLGRRALTYCLPLLSPAAQPKVPESVWQRRRKLDLPRRLKSPEKDIPTYKLPTGPLALLHVHPQIAIGAAKVFYRRNTFRFNGMRAIQTFLNMIAPSSKEVIKHLEIAYARYVQPELIACADWKTKSDENYEDTLFRIGSELKGLQTFKMDYKVNDCPLDVGPDAEWRAPFGLLTDMGLRKVSIYVHTRFEAHTDAMEVESYLIEQELLDEKYRDTYDAVERRSNPEKPVKLLAEYKRTTPAKILNITIPGYSPPRPKEITTPLMAVPVKRRA